MMRTAQPKIEPWVYLSFQRGCFMVGIGVNFPVAVQDSDRDRPGPIAGFDPLQQLSLQQTAYGGPLARGAVGKARRR
jgi:hypothetical protein